MVKRIQSLLERGRKGERAARVILAGAIAASFALFLILALSVASVISTVSEPKLPREENLAPDSSLADGNGLTEEHPDGQKDWRAEEENEMQKEEDYYKKMSDEDFFSFNGHGANYTYSNDKELTVPVAGGGVLSVGKKSASVQGKQTGIVLNVDYSGGKKGHQYGFQVFMDGPTNTGSFFALCDNENRICRMENFQDWLGVMTEVNGELVPSSQLGTLCYWRTWDQRYNPKYVDDTHFGIAWTRDEAEAGGDGDILIRLYDYNDAAQIGVFRLTIPFDYETRTYSIGTLEAAPVLRSNAYSSQITSSIKKEVADTSIRSLLDGDYFMPANGFGEFSTDDVDVYEVAKPLWCETVNQSGEVTFADELSYEGVLVAATIKRTDSSHGPITLYYDVTFDYSMDADGNASNVKVAGKCLGYDWYSEKTWESFAVRNGFRASQERADSALSASVYMPSYLRQH